MPNDFAQAFRKRAAYYRKLAVEAREAAEQATDPTSRGSFIRLAEGWEDLARYCEQLAADRRS